MRKKVDVAHDDWRVWIMARCISLSFVLYYIVCLPIPIQRARMAQMVERSLGKRWDLGSIPRSPIFSIIFIVTCSGAISHLKSTIHVHAGACQVSRNSNLRAWDSWAKNASNTPLNWVRHPHGLHIFILYFKFSFLFFYLFYCFI